MHSILILFAKRASDHRPVFHDFAERLSRVLRRSRPTVRVRAVEG